MWFVLARKLFSIDSLNFYFQAFNLNVLKGFIPIFSEYSKLAVKELENQVGGDEFDLQMFISRLTYRTVSGKNLFSYFGDASHFIAKMTRREMLNCLKSGLSHTFLDFAGLLATMLNVHRVETSAFDKLFENITA